MTRPYLLAGYAMPPIKRFVRSKRSVRITRTSTGYPMSPTAPRIATRLSWVFAGAGSTTNRSMSLSLVICPVAADPNRMILSGRATVRTRRTTSFSSVSSTFIQLNHTQSRSQLHEKTFARALLDLSGAPSRHHFTEGVLESLHLFGEADGEAHVRGPHRPPAPDIHFLGLQREDDFPNGALHIDHEAVRLAGHVAEVVLFQEAVGFLAHVADKLAPFRNHVFRLQAGAGGAHARDRHHAGAEPAEFP